MVDVAEKSKRPWRLSYSCRVCGAVTSRPESVRGPVPTYCKDHSPNRRRLSCRSCGCDLGKAEAPSSRRQFCDPCLIEKSKAHERAKDERRKAERAARRAERLATREVKPRDYRAERNARRIKKGLPVYTPEEHAERLARWRRLSRSREIVSARKAHRRRRAEHASKPWLQATGAAERYRLRYKHDPEFNLSERLRRQVNKKTRGIVGDAIRAGLRSKRGRSKAVERLLGFTIADVRRHLERQFVRGMTWERFARGEVHIDHIIPLSSFDLTDETEFRRAWALTNLRPLFASENLAKGARRTLLL